MAFLHRDERLLQTLRRTFWSPEFLSSELPWDVFRLENKSYVTERRRHKDQAQEQKPRELDTNEVEKGVVQTFMFNEHDVLYDYRTDFVVEFCNGAEPEKLDQTTRIALLNDTDEAGRRRPCHEALTALTLYEQLRKPVSHPSTTIDAIDHGLRSRTLVLTAYSDLTVRLVPFLANATNAIWAWPMPTFADC